MKNVKRLMLINMALLQIKSTLINPYPGLPSQAPVQKLALCDNDKGNLIVFINRQPQSNGDIITHKNIPSLSIGPTLAVQLEDGRPLMYGKMMITMA